MSHWMTFSLVVLPVPLHLVGESEAEANNDGRNLADFKYACVGYSVFLDNKDNPNSKGENRAELPFCSGIEVFSYSITHSLHFYLVSLLLFNP